ncbi:hypothetical protein GW17_00044125, partial [Ensete ventricosum]
MLTICIYKPVTQVKKFFSRSSSTIGRAIESMLKIGRLNTASGLDLPQREGMTIQAERLNFFRYLSHFRSVHRGASFAKMRTTSVRKLLPEYIPEDLEVGYVPLSFGGAYPGLYMFTNSSRFIRPVRNLIQVTKGSNNIELIGPFEQVNSLVIVCFCRFLKIYFPLSFSYDMEDAMILNKSSVDRGL